ncbi:butyrophilin-like protein 2 [Trachinotus anak]|uniref:butyrophilin-like protein 2 n=1 Tax=Trachinotus anak TaxID=443729 RepID=UPI0039F1EE89
MKMFEVFVVLLYVSQHISAVELYEGEDTVLLDCEFPTFKMGEPIVVWSRYDLSPATVHQRQLEGDKLKDQNQRFSGRTSMMIDALKTGNLSLTLAKPIISDSSTYTCTVTEFEQEVSRTEVPLLVREPPQVWYNIVPDVLVGVVVLFLLALAVFHGVVMSEKRKNTKELTPVRTWVIAAVPVLLIVLLVALYSVILYKRSKNTEVSQHADIVEVCDGVELVVLPCEDSSVPKHPTVVWTRNDLNPSTVHQHRRQGDDFHNQNQRYSGRTSMKTDGLITGDLSLILRKPHISDSGNYTCTMTAYGNEMTLRDIQLQVKEPYSVRVEIWVLLAVLAVSVGVIVGLGAYMCHREFIKRVHKVVVEEGVESVKLPFKTTAYLPKDVRVEWRDSYRTVHMYQNGSDLPEEQNWFYRGQTAMNRNLRRTGDLSLTLKYPTDGGIFTCTVYNKWRIIKMEKKFKVKVKVQKVVVEEGVESVKLPFKTTAGLPKDVRVEWRESYRTIHVYQNGSEHPEEQNQVYRGRTEMNEELLRAGDLSLTLKYPTDGDTGKYRCSVYTREGNILMKKQLKVQVKVQRVRVAVEEGVESVLLPFNTTADLPEDVRVEWKNSYRKVHVYQNGSDHPEEQDHIYRGRTEMNEELLRTGDLSLTLKYPTDGDTGEYRCSVYKDGNFLRWKTVLLMVEESVTFQIERVTFRNRRNAVVSTPLVPVKSV